MRNHRRGYTLFEMILAVAIMAIIAALAVPSLSTMYGDTPTTAAADKVKASWAEARSRAITENRSYKFAVIEHSGRFRVAPDSPEFWDAVTPPLDGESLILDELLPQNVCFRPPDDGTPVTAEQADAAGDWSASVVFLPDGTAREDAAIAFSEANSRPLLLQLRATTGAVTTSR